MTVVYLQGFYSDQDKPTFQCDVWETARRIMDKPFAPSESVWIVPGTASPEDEQ